MEAKDTVMLIEPNKVLSRAQVEMLLVDQAEISFKAGLAEGETSYEALRELVADLMARYYCKNWPSIKKAKLALAAKAIL